MINAVNFVFWLGVLGSLVNCPGPRPRSARPLRFADHSLADIGGDSLSALLGGRGDERVLFVAEVDAADIATGVRVPGASLVQRHVSESSESTRGMSTRGLDTIIFPSTFTSMRTTRETLAEMATNPSVRPDHHPITIDDDHPDFDQLADADAALADRIHELLGLANVAVELGLIGAAEVAIADAQPLIEQRRDIHALVGAR